MLEEFSLNNDLPAFSLVKVQQEAKNLSELNLEDELLKQYQKAKEYLEDIEGDSTVPPNQVAQVMNTCTAILKEIVKTQAELYNSERAKRLETEVVAAMRLAPPEAQEEFFKKYLEMSKDAK